nr:MAG TPA: hypothetical protein [Bacteriophage sp.]
MRIGEKGALGRDIITLHYLIRSMKITCFRKIRRADLERSLLLIRCLCMKY